MEDTSTLIQQNKTEDVKERSFQIQMYFLTIEACCEKIKKIRDSEGGFGI